MNTIKARLHERSVGLMGLGVFGKDLRRGANVVLGVAAVIVLMDVAFGLVGLLAPSTPFRRMISVGAGSDIVTVGWLVTAYCVGLALSCEEEESGSKAFLATLPAPMQRHYWTKLAAGIVAMAFFVPLVVLGYAITSTVIANPRDQTMGIGELLATVWRWPAPGLMLPLTLSVAMIGHAWGVVARGNAAVSAVLGFVVTLAVVGSLEWLFGESQRQAGWRQHWARPTLFTALVGVCMAAIGSRAWNAPTLGRRGFLEGFGIQITITSRAGESLSRRMFLLPTVAMAGAAPFLLMLPVWTGMVRPIPQDDLLEEFGWYLVLMASLAAAFQGIMALEPAEQDGQKFFLHYQAVNYRWFVVKRLLMHGTTGAVVGLCASFAVALVPGVSEFWKVAALTTISGACAGMYVYTIAACFRFRIIIAALATALAMAVCVPGFEMLQALTKTENIQGYWTYAGSDMWPAYRLIGEQFLWVILLILALPFLGGLLLHLAGETREKSQTKKQVIGVLFTVQAFALGIVLTISTPSDIWTMIFP